MIATTMARRAPAPFYIDDGIVIERTDDDGIDDTTHPINDPRIERTTKANDHVLDL